MTEQYKDIIQFCEDQFKRENDIAELRREVNDAVEHYAKQHNVTQKSVKKTYAHFKELRKDRTEAEIVERERELLIEAMIEAEVQP